MTAAGSADLEAVADELGTPAPVAAATLPREGRDRIPAWLGGLIGFAILLALWEILAVTAFHAKGSGVPTPTSVVSQFWKDWQSGLYGKNIGQTMKEAATGFVVANLLALVLGIAFVQIPLVEKGLLRIAIASYCLPLVAIGPILTFVLHGDAPKSALAGLIVFFPSLVGVVVGLRSADTHALDLITASGGGPWVQLFKVRLRAALPTIFAVLKIAAPSAILGAIVGEYLGNQDHGLGILMINSQATLEIPRTWGVALVCTAIAGFCYFVIGLVGRVVAPWASPQPGR